MDYSDDDTTQVPHKPHWLLVSRYVFNVVLQNNNNNNNNLDIWYCCYAPFLSFSFLTSGFSEGFYNKAKKVDKMYGLQRLYSLSKVHIMLTPETF